MSAIETKKISDNLGKLQTASQERKAEIVRSLIKIAGYDLVGDDPDEQAYIYKLVGEFLNETKLRDFENPQQIWDEIIAESGGSIVEYTLTEGASLDFGNQGSIHVILNKKKIEGFLDKLNQLISKYGLTGEIITLNFDPKGRLSRIGQNSKVHYCKFEQHGTNKNRQLEILNLFITNSKQYTAKEIAVKINYYEPGGATNIIKEIKRLIIKARDDLSLPDEKRYMLIIHPNKYQLNPMFQIKIKSK